MSTYKWNVTGLSETINHLESYRDSLEWRVDRLINALINIGYDIADYKFMRATYDGLNDVELSVTTATKRATLKANGKSVLFIEFGTGITYTKQNPNASKYGFERGSYGKGYGNNKEWVYAGVEGTNGRVIGTTASGEDKIITSGNPPANAMYDAAKEMRENIAKLAREYVFYD